MCQAGARALSAAAVSLLWAHAGRRALPEHNQYKQDGFSGAGVNSSCTWTCAELQPAQRPLLWMQRGLQRATVAAIALLSRCLC